MSLYQEEQYRKKSLELWWKASRELPCIGEKYSLSMKLKNEIRLNKFLSILLKHLECFPASEESKICWKQQLQLIINDFSNEFPIFSREDYDYLFSLGIFETTKCFVTEVRAYDKFIKFEEIGQAMRNVWIMNIIQVLLGMKVQYTTAIFGYSMLYPYTDNFLDDIKIDLKEKEKICNRFGRRLGGEKLIAESQYEEKLFHMVGKIEEQYNRRVNSKVFHTLLLIHEGQMNSLIQQKGNMLPYDRDILGISADKGGASVLADAYLVSGRLNEHQEEFFFNYGVLLQLCDDLQDALEDKKNNHMTIFSQLYGVWPMDSIASKLINFVHMVMETAEFPECENYKKIKELIIKNCTLLVLFSICRHYKMFSREYLKEVSAYLPFRGCYTRKLYKKLKRKYVKICRLKGEPMVEEMLVYGLG